MYKRLEKRIKKKFKYIMVNVLASSIITPHHVRTGIYKLMGMDIKTNSISPRCFFSETKVSIGKGTFINYNCFFENSGRIEIGRHVSIGPEVMVCTATHEIGEENKRALTAMGYDIHIKDGCWIGARATILPGVTINKGCIIAAGSVVTKDCEPNGLYAGVPVKRIKDLPQSELGSVPVVRS
ncbi:DapH/DapD/GlmU-related protein [Evansella sp. AB-rgal1]|uniref:acyltransferase n=1 Tax=Evansella sp. AB-rgal1 TaxID=3242696 RepID=UPI00359E9AEA